MTDTVKPLLVPANTDHDPYLTVQSALDWLLMLRKESLKLDVAAMSPARRCQHEEAMAKAALAIEHLLSHL